MANLSLPTEVALPFLRHELKNNEPSYHYLKDIVLSKRDREQRQKLLPSQDSKSNHFKTLLAGPQSDQFVFCLRLTASRGMLGYEDLHLRLVCKGLKTVNLDIVYRLPVSLERKWKSLCNPKLGKDYGKDAGESLEVEEIIQLDVQRSLQIHAETLSPQDLK
jgi:hypothetical protein